MPKTILYGLFLLILGLSTGYAQEVSNENSVSRYYYDKEAGKFLGVPETREGVDSLLAISRQNRNIDLRKGLEAARKGMQMAKSLQYQSGIAHAHNLLGISFVRLGAPDQGLEHYFTSLDMYREQGNKDRAASLLSNIALLHMFQENYAQAAEYFKKAINQQKEIGNDTSRVVTTVNLGVNYYYQGKYEQSLKYYRQALKVLNGPVDYEFMKMITLTNIGNSYVELGEYERAERNLLQAIGYFDRNNLTRNQAGAYLYLAKLYQRWGSRDEQALEYARRGLEKAKTADNKQYIIEGYERLAEIYEDQNDYRQAYNLYKQFKAVQDSLLNSERMAKIEEMQTRFDVDQKNKEIELLNKEAALKEAQLGRQKLWRAFLIIGLILFAVIMGLLYRYNNQKKRANALLEEKNREIEQKNKQLVRLNEEKDEFIGMAAHDLRNPLSGITSVASMLKTDHDIPEEEFEEYVDLIGLSADRMLNLINNLLDVNAIENGSNRVDIESVDIQKPLKRTVNNFKTLAEKKQIGLVTHFDSDSLPVMADVEAVQRVLENLLSNAIKYAPVGSTVAVSTQLQESKMELSVKDEGPGIPDEEKQQLFERYSKLSTKTTGNESSTGLGLFIVKNLVEEMQGSVRCESRPGEGAEFIITLPVAVDKKI